MNPVKLILIGLAMTALTGCTRNFQWEEEVLLNTGETIWITKEVSYSIKGQPGNPADMGYLSDQIETTSFKYGGRGYRYKGDAPQLMVLAISPDKQPVLLAPAKSRNWGVENNYKCTKPYYVQLMPDSSGSNWRWPDKIEPWTYNLPTNLMLKRDHPSKVKSRYTLADKSQQGFLKDPRLINILKINPDLVTNNCVKAD